MTEEGDVLCGKVVAAMWVFPQIYVVPADGPFVLKYVVQTPCILIIKPLVMTDRLFFISLPDPEVITTSFQIPSC